MSATVHLVLLPGMDGTGKLFGPLVAALPPGWTTQVVEYPRTEPRSYDQLTQQVREQLPTDRPYLIVAESFSGPIGIRVSAEHPQGLGGLVLVATFARTPAPWLSSGIAERIMRRLASIRPPRLGLRFFLTGADTTDDLAELLRECASSVDPVVLAARLRDILEVNVTSRATEISVPCLYLAGRRDRLVGARSLNALRAAIPNLEVEHVDGPHLLLQTRPAACLQAISGWDGPVSSTAS